MAIMWLTIRLWWQSQLQHRALITRLACFAFIMGTIFGPFLHLDLFFGFCLILVGIIMTVLFFKTELFTPVLFACFLFVGIWRYQIAMPQYSDNQTIHFYYEQKVVWQGMVVIVQNRVDQQKLVVDARAILESGKHLEKVRGRVLVSTALWPKFNYGDVLEIECKLKKPQTWDDFDYAQYLAKDNIYTTCNFATIKKISAGQGNPFLAILYNTRSYLQQRLYQTLAEPHVSIIDGMILGNAYGIPKQTNALFSALGLTHIIAISGSHIVLMISLCMWLAITCRLKRQQAFFVAVMFVIVYIIIVGAPPSAVRAGIMGVVVLLAQQVSRRHQPLHTLLLTAALMLVFNPKLLLWDIGFQLSFAAVFGLLVIAPILEQRLRLLPDFLDIRTTMSMTVAAQLATLPILIFQFRQISPWSIIANFLILPIVPFMTIYALVHVLIAGISITAGNILGWGSWVLVSYWLLTASILSQAPLVTVFFNGVWIWIGCGASVGLVLFCIMHYRRYIVSRDIL